MKHLLKSKWLWSTVGVIFIVLLYVHYSSYHKLKDQQIEKTFEELKTKAELAKILLAVFPLDSTNENDLQHIQSSKKLHHLLGLEQEGLTPRINEGFQHVTRFLRHRNHPFIFSIGDM